MAKDFKKNISKGSDMFFSANDEKPQGTQRTQGTHKTYYRINLKLEAAFKEHLKEQAWKNKKSITQYINDLIEKDIKDTQDTLNTLDTKRKEVKP
jgi:predicted DNA-binding protein